MDLLSSDGKAAILPPCDITTYSYGKVCEANNLYGWSIMSDPPKCEEIYRYRHAAESAGTPAGTPIIFSRKQRGMKQHGTQ
jgi:hypothetical protein